MSSRDIAAAPAPEGYLVVVGSSAGGIEALSVLLGSLPAGFKAPVVIAQHLDPSRASHLGSILERRCALPVVVVEEERRMAPGHVYVVPANRHVVIRDSHVALQGDHGHRPRPSVDLLLSSAAKAYGERLIAVVLTGSGSDGAAGAVEVKSAGGLVIIQDPETAAYPSMPLALPPTAVDHVAELAAIGPLLHDLVQGGSLPEGSATDEPDVLPEILALIGRHATIDFRPYKPTTILRRVGRRMAVTRNRTVRDYFEFLQSHPPEIAELVMALLIKVTEFFRDGDAFAYLDHDVLPRVIERGRENGRVLRLWSAGCATGEEAYSLALLVAERLGKELPEWTVKIFATDLDEAALNFARRGFYPANVLENLSAEHVGRYFERSEQGFRVAKPLRQMIIFGQQDITRGVPFPRIDLVVCRNLLIYFKPELQEEVLDVFAYSLHHTHGFLFLGKAETARPSRATYELVNKKWKVYRCLHGPQPATLRGSRSDEVVDRPRAAEPQPAAERVSGEAELAQLRRLNELLLRFVPVGLIVVDRQYHILTINAAGRRLLGIRESSPAQDFLHAVRGLPYEDLRTAIDQVFRERSTVSIAQVALGGLATSEPRYLNLHFAPVPSEGTSLEAVAVTAVEVTELAQAGRRLEALQTEQRQLVDELSAANRRLAESNKDLQDANEELQASNEELMLAQEELQATNEEFEATNEELQATNEELETNNEEMQATNEELEATNEELQARTGELQELNRAVTAERLRLSEMVELAPFHVIVLRGPALEIEALNPPSGRLFGEREVLGKPFDLVGLEPSLMPLLAGVHEAFRRDRPWTSAPLATSVTGPDGEVQKRTLVYSVVPTHDDDRRVGGAIIYAEDVTEKSAREDRERLDMLRLMVEHASPVALALFEAGSGTLLNASPRYLEVLQRMGVKAPAPGQSYVFEQAALMEAETASRLRRSAQQSAQPVRIAELRQAIDGRESVWDWSLVPILVGAGDGPAVRYLLLVAFDVSEPVRLREELINVDRLKDEFLAMASHELRTPLVPLTTYADLMQDLVGQAREDGAPAPWLAPFAELAPRVRRQVSYLARLTDDLLDVARLQSGAFALERRPVDLHEVLREAREQATQIAGGPRIETVQTSEPASLMGDEGRLVQAVFNLLANAARYGRGSDHIDLRLLPAADGALRIEVQDYGPGIAVQDQANLFNRFYRVPSQGRPARSGLGLGLFICRQIVERHGGSIGVDSTPGEGATFWIELRRDQREAAAGQEAGVERAPTKVRPAAPGAVRTKRRPAVPAARARVKNVKKKGGRRS